MRWTRTLGNDVPVTTISDRFVPESGALKIQNVRIEDSGNYKCFLLRNGIVGQMTIQVEVLPQSEFTPKINDTVRKFEVMYGDPLNLPCQVEKQREKLNFACSWIIISDTNFEHDLLENTRAVLHREANKYISGRYICRVENNYGYDAVDFVVKIVGK